MSRKNILLLAIVIAALLVISYCYFGGSSKHTPTESFPPDLPNPNAPAGDNKIPPPSTEPTPAAASSGGANGFLPTKMEDPKRYELLQKSFKDMSVCLNMKMGAFSENQDLNFDALMTIVTPDLGDIVTATEDWTATDLKTSNGEVRRIFIQNIPVGGAETNRVLKYSTINANGSQTEIPISKEQSQNPTDTLIASLEGDGQITSKSMARKIYFQNGDDMSVVERNGHIYSFELAHDQKLFKCSGVDAASSINCSCK